MTDENLPTSNFKDQAQWSSRQGAPKFELNFQKLDMKELNSCAIARTGTHTDSGDNMSIRDRIKAIDRDAIIEECFVDLKESARSNKYVLSFREEFSRSNSKGPRFSVSKSEAERPSKEEPVVAVQKSQPPINIEEVYSFVNMDDFEEVVTLSSSNRDKLSKLPKLFIDS